MHEDDRRARGERMFREVYGDIVPLPPPGQRDDFLALMLDQLFAEVWTRGALQIRDRRLLIMGIIAALGDAEIFALQARAAIANGELSQAQLEEIVIMLAQYVGYPRAAKLRTAVAPVLKERRRTVGRLDRRRHARSC